MTDDLRIIREVQAIRRELRMLGVDPNRPGYRLASPFETPRRPARRRPDPRGGAARGSSGEE